MARDVQRTVIARTMARAIQLMANVIVHRVTKDQSAKKNANRGLSDTIAVSVVCAIKKILWHAITLQESVCARPFSMELRLSNMRA
jgi:hypothetical protein